MPHTFPYGALVATGEATAPAHSLKVILQARSCIFREHSCCRDAERGRKMLPQLPLIESSLGLMPFQ